MVWLLTENTKSLQGMKKFKNNLNLFRPRELCINENIIRSRCPNRQVEWC